jgi:hypothetical protein
MRVAEVRPLAESVTFLEVEAHGHARTAMKSIHRAGNPDPSQKGG